MARLRSRGLNETEKQKSPAGKPGQTELGFNMANEPQTETEVKSLERNCGWFRAMRGPTPLELIRANPSAFILAYIISYRAQYSAEFNRHNLALGEALIGDHRNYGMSERQYRTAKQKLEKWHFATFKATTKGTIAKLTDTRLFSIFRLESDGQKDKQPTGKRRPSDGQPTTTKNLRAGKNGERAERVPASPAVSRLDALAVGGT